ncbi:hypothetical protein ACTFIZ_010125 [Dictyostelium cf. discoideum]
MNNEYNESLFWEVFKNKYLLNYILKNKCCYKSKKFKTITSIDSMLKHKQYQLLICKLKANENLYFKDTCENDKIINEIKDIEVFKEVYSLLLFKGYRDGDVKKNIFWGIKSVDLFNIIWGIKSADLFDIHLKYHPEELQTYIPSMIKSIIQLNHPKLLMRVLDYYQQYLNDNKPFTLTKIERNYFIMDCIACNKFEDLDNHEEIKEKIKIISNIPISPTSIFKDPDDLQVFSRTGKNVNVRWYLKFQKLLSLGFNNIRTSFYYPAEDLDHNIKIAHKPLLPRFEKIRESISHHKDMVSCFCYGFDNCIKEHIEDVKGELEYISSSINSVLLYFKLYYCNYYFGGESKSIPTSIQTQIDIIIENNKNRRCTLFQSIKQLFQLLINETESIVLYACYLKEYNEPIDNIEPDEEMIIVLLYFMTKTYNTNILKFLLKKGIKINLTKSDLVSIRKSFLNILFKDNQINKKNINKFNKIYTSQKSIIIENIDEMLLNNIKSKKEQEDIALGDKQLNSILFSKSSSKWKEITSNLIDNDLIVTIKDKETIDWLSNIETGGCSILNIRNALNSKLKQMKLEFSTLELLEYARIKFKQVIPILDSNKELCNIHILRTHDDIESLINGLNQSKFNDNENLFKYYMIQIIQFGSKNSIKYLRLICDSTEEFYSGYDGMGGLVVSIFNYTVIRFYTNSYSYNADIWEDSISYYENEEFKKYKITNQQTCQIIDLSKIKVNFNQFLYETSNLFQTFIKLLNIEGVQFILDNLNGKDLELNREPFQDGFHNKIYTSKYLYKDLMEMIQFLIDKFKDCQLSKSNLSLILNYLFLKLIRVKNLTIDQIKTAYQLISNYIEIDSSKHTSYYYLKTLSPIIESCITIIKGSTWGSKKGIPLFDYDIDTSVYTFQHIFTNRNNNDLNQFIDSTIMDIVKNNFKMEIFSKLLYNYNPRINLFFHYFEIELRKRKANEIKEPFLDYQLLKLIIKTFDLESFIKLDNLLQQYEFYLRENPNVNSEQEGANNDDGEQKNSIIKELDEYCHKPLSTNMVEWFGTIIYKDYSDYQDIINYLFNKYNHQLKPYINYYKLKLLNQKSYFKDTCENDKIINEIKDIEVFKEVYSLLLFKGYRYGDVKILFNIIWGIKSADLFDIHLKYHPEELHAYIPSMIKSIIRLNHPKLLMRVLDYYQQYLNDNKPFTLTKIERNYFIMDCIACNSFEDLDNHEEIKEKIKIISNIPISPTSIFNDLYDLQVFSRTGTNVNVRWYLKFQKLLSLGFNNIRTSFYYPAGNLDHNIKTPHKPLLPRLEKIRESISHHKDRVSCFCYGFDKCIKEHIEDVKGELEYISSSINSVLLFFKLYYCNYYYGGESKSIPTSIQTQIDIIIENNKNRRCTLFQSIKQLFQLLINESESIVLYACYLKEYNEPIDNIEPDEEMIIVLLYFMTKTYNTNILKFLLKKGIKINLIKSDMAYIGKSFLNILFKDNQINKKNINKFNKIYTSQKSIIIEDIGGKLRNNDLISKKEQEDIVLGNKQLNSILFSKSSSKWKEITSNLIDNDMIVTIKDKETIDWLSNIETGGCSILNIRNALNSKLKQMKLDFSTLELLEYARIKFKQVIPILDSNKELCNIHILRTHDDNASIINGLNQSNFNDNEQLFKYYMIQIIQFGSKNSIKYLRFYSVYHENEEFKEYKIPTQQTCQIINLSKIKVNVNHFPNVTCYLFQTFTKLLNIEGIQFILDNLNGKYLKLNRELFQDGFHNKIYTSKYLYKDLMEMIQFLIDKFKDCQLSKSNLSLILNYLFLKLIRIKNLTIDQIKTAYQLISNYIEIDSLKHTSYYYLKTLSPIIASCITIIEEPPNARPYCDYYIDTSVYTFQHIFKNRNNNDLNQFIDSTIMDIVKNNFNIEIFSKMLIDYNNPRINLFLHYFEMELEFRKTNEIKEPFLDYQLLQLIIKTFDLESFIKLDNLLERYEIYLRENHNAINSEQEDANDGEQKNSIIKELDEYCHKPLSTNMVEWFGIIIYKDYSDYQDIINYLFNKYKHQLEPYVNYYKLKLLNQKYVYDY